MIGVAPVAERAAVGFKLPVFGRPLAVFWDVRFGNPPTRPHLPEGCD